MTKKIELFFNERENQRVHLEIMSDRCMALEEQIKGIKSRKEVERSIRDEECKKLQKLSIDVLQGEFDCHSSNRGRFWLYNELLAFNGGYFNRSECGKAMDCNWKGYSSVLVLAEMQVEFADHKFRKQQRVRCDCCEIFCIYCFIIVCFLI